MHNGRCGCALSDGATVSNYESYVPDEGWVLVPKENYSIPFIVCTCFVIITIITIDIVFFVVVFFFLVVAATTTFLVPKPKSSLSARSLPGSSGKERTLDCIVEAALAFDGWWLF